MINSGNSKKDWFWVRPVFSTKAKIFASKNPSRLSMIFRAHSLKLFENLLLALEKTRVYSRFLKLQINRRKYCKRYFLIVDLVSKGFLRESSSVFIVLSMGIQIFLRALFASKTDYPKKRGNLWFSAKNGNHRFFWKKAWWNLPQNFVKPWTKVCFKKKPKNSHINRPFLGSRKAQNIFNILCFPTLLSTIFFGFYLVFEEFYGIFYL